MNMEKRLLLALSLSFIVLAVWSNFVVKPKPNNNSQVYQQEEIAVEKSSPAPAIISPPKVKTEPVGLFEFSQNQRKLIFDELTASIDKVVFSNHQEYVFPLKNCLQVGENLLSFSRQNIDNKRVAFFYLDATKKISKEFIFSDAPYEFEFVLKVENLSESALALNLPVFLGTINPASNNDKMAFHGVTAWSDDKAVQPNYQKNGIFNKLKFISIKDRYFCAIVAPEIPGSHGFIARNPQKESEVGLNWTDLQIVPRGTWQAKFKVYIGPQDAKTLKKIDPDWQSVIFFGKFDLIAQGMLMLLELYHKLFHNWGWVIIFLSLTIYLILYPLTAQQMNSMKQMQALQPNVEEIKNQYKGNTQKQHQEIMELYRKHGVNPLGGCLPMILQIPIFFTLYQVLTRTIALKGADFLWIKDLSEPDKLFLFPQTIPLLGNEFNILPILMAIEMAIQQKFSMSSVNAGQAEQQKIMMIIMPIMFGFLFYRMPSGLVLYWFINSTLTMVYQLRVAGKK